MGISQLPQTTDVSAAPLQVTWNQALWVTQFSIHIINTDLTCPSHGGLSSQRASYGSPIRQEMMLLSHLGNSGLLSRMEHCSPFTA